MVCLSHVPYINGNGRFGYFGIWIGGKQYKLHRIIYEMHNGPIPVGFEVDHICNNPACCNPKHLQALSKSDHIQITHQRRREAKYGKQLTLPLMEAA